MQWLTSLINGLRGLLEGDFSSLDSKLATRVGDGLLAMTLLVAAYFVSKGLSRYTAAAVCRRVDETLGRFLGRLTFYSAFIAATLGILAQFGVSVAGAMAVLTAAGFAIGLAFQGTLSNFAAGVLLLVFRPFKVGDMVVAAGVTGKVNEVDLFTTTLDTPDNRRLIVPNSAIAGGTIENMTFHAHRRVDVVVGVAYSADLEQTRTALLSAAAAISDLLVPGEKRGYQVLLGLLGASSVEWTVRFWTRTDTLFVARERLTAEIKTQLERVGIEIAFPQLQLHMTPASGQALPPESRENVANSPLRPRMRRSESEAA
jgi:small conductance mechanosensitive channel